MTCKIMRLGEWQRLGMFMAPLNVSNAPSNLVATALSSTSIELTWTSAPGVYAGYVIERSPNGTVWTEIARIAEPAMVLYINSDLDANTLYYYRVATYTGIIVGDYSNIANATTEVFTALNQYALDRCTDVDNTDLDAHTMNIGTGWTEHNGVWDIISNAIRQSTSTAGGYIATTDIGTPNCIVTGLLQTVNGSGQHDGEIVVRYTDLNNWISVQIATGAPTQFRILKLEAGVGTILQAKTYPMQYQKAIKVKVECNGNTITAWADGGYKVTGTTAFNNTATRFGFREGRGTYGPWFMDQFEAIALPTYPITYQGAVIEAIGEDYQEPEVLIDHSPQILAGDTVFKMWFTKGLEPADICYAESLDGSTWTQYGSNPVIVDHQHHCVFKEGNNYHCYATSVPTRNQVDYYTSADGISWVLDTANVIAQGGVGTWDATDFGNILVWKEGANDWRMLYEAKGLTPLNYWQMGYATSPDGTTWTKYGSNPVLVAGGANLFKVNGVYYLWAHRASSGLLPTYIMRFKSSNLTTWEEWPNAIIIPRSGADEGEDTYTGQVADVNIVEKDGTAYIYYMTTVDGDPTIGQFKIKLGTADANIIAGF